MDFSFLLIFLTTTGLGWLALKEFVLDDREVKTRALNLAARYQMKLAAHKTARSKVNQKPQSSLEFLKPYMNKAVDRLKLLKSKQADAITDKLSQAGWRNRDAKIAYLFAKLVLPLLAGGIVALWFYGLNQAPAADLSTNMLYSIAAVLVGYYLPELIIKNAADRRRQKLQKSLPDTLDLLVICAEAGLSYVSALDRVAREIKKNFPEMAEELSITSAELNYLPDRREAFENLRRRINLKQISGLVSTLIQTEKYGTPLARSLRVLASEFRHERLMKAEEKAARLPALLTLPMIVFILPPLFIVLIGPGILKTIDAMSYL